MVCLKYKLGRGKHIYADGSWYDGEWKDDLRNGWRISLSKTGEWYSVYWKNNEMDSVGVMEIAVDPLFSNSIARQTFVGIYKNGVAYNGVLTIITTSKEKKEATVKDGVWGKVKKVRN